LILISKISAWATNRDKITTWLLTKYLIIKTLYYYAKLYQLSKANHHIKLCTCGKRKYNYNYDCFFKIETRVLLHYEAHTSTRTPQHDTDTPTPIKDTDAAIYMIQFDFINHFILKIF
jgi:hypothetical protein